jgi:hypothetical protein
MRSDLFEKRRRLMTAWADHCANNKQGAKGKVIPMHATAHAFPKSQAGAAPKRWRHG